MDLELATTTDMIEELQRRGLSFVLVAYEPTNHRTQRNMILAGHGESSEAVLNAMRTAYREFQRRTGSRDGSDDLNWNEE